MTDWTGAEIRQRRKHYKLTQQQLADALGTTVSAVSKWESSQDRPRITGDHLERLERTLPLPDDPDYQPAHRDRWANPPAYRSHVDWNGLEIVRRRRQLGYHTQESLAKALDVSVRTVTGWEAEGKLPSTGHVRRLQHVLWLPSDDPGHDPGVALSEASKTEILDRLGGGPLLGDATFSEVLLRMVELHNRQRQQEGLPPLLDLDGAAPGSDHPEHDTVEGPTLDSPGQSSAAATDQDDAHSR